MNYPKCMESLEYYNEWLEIQKAYPTMPENDYCYDCNPEHKKEMAEGNRCQHLNVKFYYRFEHDCKEETIVGIRGGYVKDFSNGHRLIEEEIKT